MILFLNIMELSDKYGDVYDYGEFYIYHFEYNEDAIKEIVNKIANKHFSEQVQYLSKAEGYFNGNPRVKLIPIQQEKYSFYRKNYQWYAKTFDEKDYDPGESFGLIYKGNDDEMDWNIPNYYEKHKEAIDDAFDKKLRDIIADYNSNLEPKVQEQLEADKKASQKAKEDKVNAAKKLLENSGFNVSPK